VPASVGIKTFLKHRALRPTGGESLKDGSRSSDYESVANLGIRQRRNGFLLAEAVRWPEVARSQGAEQVKERWLFFAGAGRAEDG